MNTSAEPAPLRFLRRFRNGTLCEMTIRFTPDGRPCHRPYYLWKGPVPRLRGERLDWELACFRAVAERTNSPMYYGAALTSGEIKFWRCDPGRKPARITPDELASDGAIIVAADNTDDKGKVWLQ